MQITFLEIAQIELDDSIAYYNSEFDGLGYEFLSEVLHSLDRINSFPHAWHPFTDTTRRCQLHRFPYGIVYQILNTEILIVAIANLHRNPDYWKDRIRYSSENIDGNV